jgi:hypothetical protein
MALIQLNKDTVHPITFARTFLLQPIPGQPGGYFVYSDIFRIFS